MSVRRTSVVVVTVLAMAVPIVALSPGIAAAGGPAMVVTPNTGLVDGQTISVVATGVDPNATLVFTQCGSAALKIFTGQLPPDINPADGCNAQRNTILYSDSQGVVAGTLAVNSVMSTAVGPDDCRTDSCFVALFVLHGSGGPLIQSLSFDRGPVPPSPPPVQTTPSSPGALGTASTGSSVTISVPAGVAGDVTTPGATSGPYRAPFAPSPSPASPVAGEGLLRLALSGDGTSWGSASDPAAVVDVSVDGGATQQLVLFNGSTPFAYAGFTGPLTTGTHSVTVTVDPALSTGTAPPVAQIQDVSLTVVDPTNPSYLAYAYAPVMYGRSTSAAHDTPLITYAGSTPQAGGATSFSYTVIWSHENAGTGFIPWLLSGGYGRTTDIENAISFTVQPDGSVTNASYLWGGQPPDYPDTQGAISETDVPFAGAYDGHHPVIRDATGNNDFSDIGTTAFRFQQVPVAPPAPGQTREGAMDANPWTYRIMGEESARFYTNASADPLSPQIGDARQYAIVQYSISGTGAASVGIDLQLARSDTWYENDLGSGYPFAGVGQGRTVVKLPVGWQGTAITGLRLRVFPAAAAASVHLDAITVQQLADDWTLSTVSVPAPQIVGAAPTIPASLQLAAVSGSGQSGAAGMSLAAPLVARVADSLGEPVAGAAVTFTAPASGASVMFASCSCATETVTSGADGIATSGPLTTGSAAGAGTVFATTVDPLTRAVPFTVTTTTNAPPTTASPSTTPPTTAAPTSAPGAPTGGFPTGTTASSTSGVGTTSSTPVATAVAYQPSFTG